MSPPYDLDCEHFTAGAIGPPGQRVFYLQAGGEGRIVTLRCEKQQVGALGEYFDRLLADLPGGEEKETPAPELIEPVEPAWVVGSLVLGYDAAIDRLVLLIEEAGAEDPDDPEEAEEAEEAESGQSARWVLRREQARSFSAHARELISGGRPTCRFCGRPMDPSGHSCPKTNGKVPH